MREVIKNEDSSVTLVLFPELLMYSVEYPEFYETIVQEISKICTQMESRKYFKFYLNLPLNQINPVESLFKDDSVLSRYNGYTECRVNKGKLCDIPIYSYSGKVNLDSDSVIKVYCLKQESRVQLLKDSNITDYHGSLIEDVISTYSR